MFGGVYRLTALLALIPLDMSKTLPLRCMPSDIESYKLHFCCRKLIRKNSMPFDTN